MATATGILYKNFTKDNTYWGSKVCDGVRLLVNGKEYNDDVQLIEDEATATIEDGLVYEDEMMTRKVDIYSLFLRWYSQYFLNWLESQS